MPGLQLCAKNIFSQAVFFPFMLLFVVQKFKFKVVKYVSFLWFVLFAFGLKK
jgi:hypothetical protein